MKFLVSLLIIGALGKLSFAKVIRRPTSPSFVDSLETGSQEILLRQKRNEDETWTPAPVPGATTSKPTMSLAEQEVIRNYKEDFERLKKYKNYAEAQYYAVDAEASKPNIAEVSMEKFNATLWAYKNELIKNQIAELPNDYENIRQIIREIGYASTFDRKLELLLSAQNMTKEIIKQLDLQLYSARGKIHINKDKYHYGTFQRTKLENLERELKNAESSNATIQNKISVLKQYDLYKYLIGQ